MTNSVYLTKDETIWNITVRIRRGKGMRDILESATGRWVQSESLVARFTLERAPTWVKDWNQVKDAVRKLGDQVYGGHKDYLVYAQWEQQAGDDVSFRGLKMVPAINYSTPRVGLENDYIGSYTVR